MNRVITTIIILALVVVGAAFIFADTETQAEQGTIIFAVTDAAADMENVTAVQMTVNGVDLRTSSGTWVQATDKTETFDLLELNASGRLALLARTDVNAGTYDGIRLHISEVTVTTDNGSETLAVLTGKEIVIDGHVTVTADGAAQTTTEATSSGTTEGKASNQTVATAVFDVQADESLHVTADGKYVFAPVVELTAQTEAQAEVAATAEAENDPATVVIRDGTTTATVLVGVDADGETRMNFQLDSSLGIHVTADGAIELLGGAGTETDSEATTTPRGAEAGVEADLDANADLDLDTEATDSGEIRGQGETQVDVEIEAGL